MHRTVNRKLLKQLVKKMGRRATGRLAEKASIGQSTIEKLMAGTYSSFPKDLTRHQLSGALGISENELFPLVTAKGKVS